MACQLQARTQLLSYPPSRPSPRSELQKIYRKIQKTENSLHRKLRLATKSGKANNNLNSKNIFLGIQFYRKKDKNLKHCL